MFAWLVRCNSWLRRVTGNNCTLGDVSRYHGPSADDRACANTDARKHDRACADERALIDDYLAREPYSRADVDTITYDAIVINGCGRIHDDGLT